MSLDSIRTPSPGASRRVLERAAWGLVAALLLATGAYAGSYSFGSGSKDEDDHPLQWALLDGDDNVTSSTWSHGSWKTIERLRARNEKLLWFRVDDRDYVVTDRSALGEVETTVRPMVELGKQQGQLGRVQGELGRKQGRLGREQGKIGALQGRLSVRLALIDAGDDRSRRRAELRDQLDELAEMQRDLADAQRPLAERQRELAGQQQDLAELQREATAEVARDLERLTARWISDGRAKPIAD